MSDLRLGTIGVLLGAAALLLIALVIWRWRKHDTASPSASETKSPTSSSEQLAPHPRDPIHRAQEPEPDSDPRPLRLKAFATVRMGLTRCLPPPSRNATACSGAVSIYAVQSPTHAQVQYAPSRRKRPAKSSLFRVIVLVVWLTETRCWHLSGRMTLNWRHLLLPHR
jgi:hypothetical protein